MNSRTTYRFLTSISIIAMVFVGLEVFTYSSDEIKTEDENYQLKFNQDYRVYSLNIPGNLTFCGEEVPVYDQDVRERLDRELLVNTYWQSNSLLYHKRASKWFPVIEPILKENGVPDDFKYLCLVESGLMNVVSPAGATGFWQILKKTGQEYGLEVNSGVDERYNVIKSTNAAAHYLKDAYDIYESWTLAAASYNMGMGGVNKQLKRQKVDTYYDLLLNNETSRYVFRIIAAKEILENPTKYGFHYREKDLYEPPKTYSVVVDTTISDLAAFAVQNNVNYKILKIFNPWMRQSYLPNKSGRKYEILFPKSGYFDFSSTELPTPVDSSSSAVDTLQLEENHE